MIIKLTIENYKSFLESTTVDFTSGTAFKLSGNLLKHRNGERFVKSMALYGANASGKTTVLDGLYALKQFVLFSGQDQKPTSPVPHFEPFALDRVASARPARIALSFDVDGDRYTIDVSATAERVWRETLELQRVTTQPSRKTSTKTLIERTWAPEKKKYSTILHEDLASELTRTAVVEQTTPNRLMLGKLASMNNDIAGRINQWFDKDLEIYDMHRNPFSELAVLSDTARRLRENPQSAAMIERFMKDADMSIQELHIVDEKAVQPVYSDSDKTLKFKECTEPDLSFRHATADGSEIFFRRSRESSGTLRFVALLAVILQPGARRRLVCVDELSASMHPDLVRRLIRIVHSREYNPLGNQLLFTTHDTHLIDPIDLLRRDQVTICTKNRFGRSSTKRLDKFNDSARSDANLQKQYLQGRFGGKPQFGPTLEDVEVDDEPLEIVT